MPHQVILISYKALNIKVAAMVSVAFSSKPSKFNRKEGKNRSF